MRLLKFFLAVVLMPLLVALAQTALDFGLAAYPVAPWQAVWFWGLLAGVILWLIIFFALPRPMWLYVLGHELTHALAAKLAGGKIYGFRVGSKGGQVLTDRVTWWIALAPYFVPLYTLIWLGIWFSIHFYWPLDSYRFLLFFGLGLTYAFHLTFTFWMFHPSQPDLSSEGYLFSTVIILILNLFFISLFLFFMVPALSGKGAGILFMNHLQKTYATVGVGIGRVIHQLYASFAK